MSDTWVVMKFGGTSVAGRPQWDAIARLVAQRRAGGDRVLVVCSALAGVTDALEALARQPGDRARMDAIVQRHARHAEALDLSADDVLEAGRQRLLDGGKALDAAYHPALHAEFLATGEWLSSQLGARFIEAGQDCAWVDVREALTACPEPDPDGKRAWLSARCEAFADPELAERWRELAPVLVTQGFVARHADGRTALLGRGGSDTSAALLASRLEARVVEIWTDVDGLYSADPRLEPQARRIARLSYAEALEMAAGGARVMHGRGIRAAGAAGIPIEIRNLSRPKRAGTRIAGEADPGPTGIRAVTCQPHMAVLLLENLDTRQQVGFLAGVFSAIAERGISVDQVATSETTTTLAISREANHLDAQGLDELRADLSGLCRVEVHPDCACVNLVGRGARSALARLGPVGAFFDERPLLMLSQSANDLCLSLLVRAEDSVELQRLLHRELVMSAACA